MFSGRSALLLILILTTVVRISILNWGLPSDWNSRFSYNIDESTYLAHCANLDLNSFDLDPDIGKQHPHLSTYYTAFNLVLGKTIGLYELPSSKINLISNPTNYGAIIRFQRIMWGLIPGLLLVLISYLVGKELKGKFLAILLALGAAFSPTFLINGNYGVENTVVPLLFAIAFLFLLKWFKQNKDKYLYWAGVSLGVCCAIKLSGVLIAVMIVSAWLAHRKLNWKNFKTLCLTGFISILSFCILSPYYLLNFLTKKEPLNPLEVEASPLNFFKFDLDFIITNILNLGKVTALQVGILFLVLGLLGLKKTLFDKKYFPILMMMICFYIISSFVNIVMGSRLTPVAWAWVVLGGSFIANLYEKKKSLAKVLISALIISLGTYSYAVVDYFNHQNTRELASQFLLSKYQNQDSITIGVNTTPSYAYPNLVSHQWTKNKYNISFFEGIPECSLQVYENQNSKNDWLVQHQPELMLVTLIEKNISNEGYQSWQNATDQNGGYSLSKYYPKYANFGLDNLTIYEWDLYIYQRN